MRADRLLSILLLLQPGRRLTARELADRLEVSERTILRDMEALSAAGVPVTAERGVGGGWSLIEKFRTDLTGLNTAELQALFFAKSSKLLGDLGLSQASEAALIKLLAALPAVARRSIELARERLHVDGAGWYQSREEFPLLPLVQQAVWQERKLEMTYRRDDGSKSERCVDPLGLVAKGGIWYLVATHDGELRSYRISRIAEAKVTDQPCTRPDNFDLAAHWERSVADFKANVPRYPVTLEVTRAQLDRLRRARYARIESEDATREGWVRVDVAFEVEGEACGYVVRAGGQAIVVSPRELRDLVLAQARSILAHYPDRLVKRGRRSKYEVAKRGRVRRREG